MAKALTELVDKNIQKLLHIRQKEEQERSFQQKVADAIGTFAGSVPFVYLHLVIFGLWLLINWQILPITKPWDPYPFVMLAMIASVESIFLSTFVLINQNRSAMLSEKRADLDLQVSLLTEHELTRLIHMVEALMKKTGTELPPVADLDVIKEDIPADLVMERIDTVRTPV